MQAVDIRRISETVTSHLAEVDAVFKEELVCDLPCVNELVDHAAGLRGKMLRPVLVLLSGQASGELKPAHITIAAVVEMAHMATLVHDDVLDEADLRRGKVTLNRLKGNEAAVMLGDYLISHSYHLCSSLDRQHAARVIARTTNQLCEGELLQLHNRGNLNLDEEAYLTIISRKTASLIAASCYLGAHFAGADETTSKRLEKFGLSLGIAFQIQDDILDLIGDTRVVGKTLGIDVSKRKLTLPLIHFLQNAPTEHRKLCRNLLAAEEPTAAARVKQLVAPSKSITYARERAERLVDRAKQSLTDIPDGEAKNALLAMADFAVGRIA